MACPICGRPVVADYRPFCSKRCADVDLSRWLGGEYRIPDAPGTADQESEIESSTEGEERLN